MTKDEAAGLIDLIVSRAADLRGAGVLRVDLGAGAGFTLAPAEAEPDGADLEQDDGAPVDALHDAWTHGVPGPGTPKTMTKRTRRL